jgi:hypothetical protein
MATDAIFDNQFVTDFLHRIRDEVVPRIVKATVPFYAIQDDKIKRDRSGVLLRVGDELFILTASHDLRAIVNHQIHLYVGWDQEEKVPWPIVDSTFNTSEEEIRDIAVVKLSKEAARKLSATYEPISMREVQRHPDRSDAFFIVCGYPQEWLEVAKDHIDSRPLPYLARLYKTGVPPMDQLNFDPSVHFLIDFSKNAVTLGTKQKAGDWPSRDGMKGISGCGVWRIVGHSQDEMKKWRPDDIALAGIQHRVWYTDECAAATRINYAMHFLEESYPEIGPALRIVYPK